MPHETSSSLAGAAARITSKRWTRILVPLLFLYMINFIDRNNIGFAVIGGMNEDLGIGNAEAGLAGGLFYSATWCYRYPAASSPSAST